MEHVSLVLEAPSPVLDVSPRALEALKRSRMRPTNVQVTRTGEFTRRVEFDTEQEVNENRLRAIFGFIQTITVSER